MRHNLYRVVVLMNACFLFAHGLSLAQDDQWVLQQPAYGGPEDIPNVATTAEKYGYDKLSSKAKDVVFSQIIELILCPERERTQWDSTLPNNDLVRETNKNKASNRALGENIQHYREGLIAGWCYALETLDVEELKNDILKEYQESPHSVWWVLLDKFQSTSHLNGLDITLREDYYMTIYLSRSTALLNGYRDGKEKIAMLVTNAIMETSKAITENEKEFLFKTPVFEALVFLKQTFHEKMKEDKVTIEKLFRLVQDR